MAKSKLAFRKILLIFSLLLILMCPALYFASEFSTSSLTFLEPLLCPPGMQLNRITESISDPQGNATASYLVCTEADEEVDITGRMLVILFGLAILGGVLLVTWALMGSKKELEPPMMNKD